MTFPPALLIHSASLETGETLGSADAYGVKATTKTYATVSCRFGSSNPSYPREESGDRVLRRIVCILPVTTSPRAGRRITGNAAPWNQTYEIQTVRPAYAGPAGATLSHYVLDLEAVS